MACACSKYSEMMDNTKSALAKVQLDIFSLKQSLRSLEEKSIRAMHPLKTDLSNCCQFERDKLIDLEVDLYLATCELEAYKSRLAARDMSIIATRRKAALEAYKLKYEADMAEKGQVLEFKTINEIEQMEEGHDEID